MTKLTPEDRERIRLVEQARRALPTRKQLARELGVSKSLIDQQAQKYNQVADVDSVPRGTSDKTATKSQSTCLELDRAEP